MTVSIDEVFYIGFSSDQPNKLYDNDSHKGFFGGHEGKTICQIIFCLHTKESSYPRTGSIIFSYPIITNVFEEIEVLFHRQNNERINMYISIGREGFLAREKLLTLLCIKLYYFYKVIFSFICYEIHKNSCLYSSHHNFYLSLSSSLDYTFICKLMRCFERKSMEYIYFKPQWTQYTNESYYQFWC